MAVTPQQIKELRARTSVGLMACRKALEESNGNMEEAIELLRKRGETKAAEKGDRSTSEGVVAVSGRAIVSLLCETDFVGKNETFVSFAQEIAKTAEKEGEEAAKNLFEAEKGAKIQEIGENINLGEIKILEGGDTIGSYVHSNNKVGSVVVTEGGSEEKARDVAMHATAMSPSVTFPEDVDQEAAAKEKAFAEEQLKAEGKPAEIIEKILIGKMKKFSEEQALSTQDFVKDPSQKVAGYLGDAKLVTFARISV